MDIEIEGGIWGCEGDFGVLKGRRRVDSRKQGWGA